MFRPIRQLILILCCLCITLSISIHAQDAEEIARTRRELIRTPDDMALLRILKKKVGTSDDPYEQAELTIIYYFGCLYSGETEEIRKVLYYLKKYHPDAEQLKYITPQYTHNPCSECDGHGKIKRDCETCKGNGVCKTCAQADAKIQASIADGTLRVKCEECKGSSKCKNCKGSGKEELPCLKCKSTGQVYSRDRTAMTYIALLSGNLDVLRELGAR